MGLNNKHFIIIISICFCVLLSGGCGPIIESWTDTTGMEEYGNKVAETLKVLRTYIGKNQDVIRNEFGEPHVVDKRIGSKAVLDQEDRVEFHEIGEYCYTRGIIMINFERGCKRFFFKDDIVVAVDAG